MQATSLGRLPLPAALTLFALCAACSADMGQTTSTVTTSATSGSTGGHGGSEAMGGNDVGGSDAGGAGTGGDPGQGGYGGSFDAPLVCNGTGPIFATHVLAESYGPGQSFGRDAMPEIVLGPPLGGGCCQGSLDVVSLGDGGLIVLGFEGNAIADGPGPDFVVFENAFEIGASQEIFVEPATVEVSVDGLTWATFGCAAATPYDGCAGVSPVHLDGDVSPIDPMAHGGDAFDLADVGLSEARFVRITDRADLGSVFDLDAVGIVHPVCP